MQDKLLYEYAVVRIVPRVEREEFLNTGIVLFCKKTGFLKFVYKIPEHRLHCFDPNIDIAQVERNLVSFQQIAAGDASAGSIARLGAPERFRWLTAVRSTIVQCGKVHPGFTTNEEKSLSELFEKLVQ